MIIWIVFAIYMVLALMRLAVFIASQASYKASADSEGNEDMPTTSNEYFDEDTLYKVRYALQQNGIPDEKITELILSMQSEGILFRESFRDETETEAYINDTWRGAPTPKSGYDHWSNPEQLSHEHTFVNKVASKDAPTVVNENGGGQSHIPVRFDLIDAQALFAMAAVLHEGAEKYGENNWRKIDVDDHLNHLLMHVYAYLAGDRSDDHLSHALCRATFALGVKLDSGPELQEQESE